MIKIGLISDTHGYLDPKVYSYFQECDQIWHAGDFGSFEVSNGLEAFKPLKGVYGNIDDNDIRTVHPLDHRFTVEDIDVWITHIGGYPGRYNERVLNELNESPPDLFICGHSHILKIVKDPKYENMLVMNPGAAGMQGLHKIRTILRFAIDGEKIQDVEAIELGKRG